MSTQKRWAMIAALAVMTAGFGLQLTATPEVQAADHTDPGGLDTLGDADDIGDLYAFHENGKLVLVLTFAGPLAPVAGQTGNYNRDVLYGVHIDNSADNVADFNIYARYGMNSLGEWGIQVSGLPGEAGVVVGPVETEIAGDNGKVWTGLRDDPFFFDLAGFQATVSSGTISFNPANDFFAGSNITTIVMEVPLTAVTVDTATGKKLSIWATTATK